MRLETRYIDIGKSISIIDRNFHIDFISTISIIYGNTSNDVFHWVGANLASALIVAYWHHALAAEHNPFEFNHADINTANLWHFLYHLSFLCIIELCGIQVNIVLLMTRCPIPPSHCLNRFLSLKHICKILIRTQKFLFKKKHLKILAILFSSPFY